MNPDSRPVCALTIAGSDSGGGAGIQADLKTFAAHRVHGLSAVAALTAQHTRGVTAVHVPDAAFLQAQIDTCFDDFRIGAVKLGMLARSDLIHTVADAIERFRPPWVVLDPVMVATSGARLLDPHALDALRGRLLPLASIVTPNLPEAAVLLGRDEPSRATLDEACHDLLAMGPAAVLLKGGHLGDGGDAVDVFAEPGSRRHLHHPRLPIEGHGTGCTLASAIAASLCRGLPLDEACAAAADYVHAALRGAYSPGRGTVVVLDHFGAAPRG